MPTTALYQWNVAGIPVNILIELPLVDRLRAACSQPDSEVGGLLSGYFDGNYTVISDFEAIDSEHRRGTAYTLSHRDEVRLGGRMEARRKRKGSEVVGFFRSHLRPGMFLDEGDNQLISSHFNDPRQVVLLIKPSPDGTASGGFFFWEDGELNRKQTYLPFPMNSRDLETGDFPLVEPVSTTGLIGNPPNFDTAETLDVLPVPPVAAPVPAAQSIAPKIPTAQKRNWPVIGLIAAGAALGGYLFGTMGTHDQFGSRPGDIVVGEPDSSPAAPQPVETAAAPPDQKPAPDQAATKPPAKPAPTLKDEDDGDRSGSRPAPLRSVPPASPKQVQLPPDPPPQPVQTASAPAGPLPQVTPPQPAPQPAPMPPPANAAPPSRWNHFGEGASPAPRTPASSAPSPSAPNSSANDGSVYLESVQNGGIRKALHHIPLLGSIGGHNSDDFVPPQAIRSFAPRIPRDLAREISGTQPVDLKLKVDRTGRVSSVELISRGTPPEFVRLAGDAAYDWQFEPAHMKDKPVDSEVIAHFVFHAPY